MDTPSENTSDEDLANLMADPSVDASSDSLEDAKNAVEVGIPPQLEDGNDNVESGEESFSINDFEEDFQTQDSDDDSEIESEVSQPVVQNIDSEPEEPSKEDTSFRNKPSSSNGDGDVAQFRETLASLSRQLELDRLAFLHESLKEQCDNLPSLNDIAFDITGKKPLTPNGDCDHYGKRPSAKLEGWVSGLSFGVSKRAKKFSK